MEPRGGGFSDIFPNLNYFLDGEKVWFLFNFCLFLKILIDSKSNPQVQSALLSALINEWSPCLFLNKSFHCLTAKEVAQRGFGLHLGDIKNPTGHDWATCSAWPSSEHPSSLSCPLILFCEVSLWFSSANEPHFPDMHTKNLYQYMLSSSFLLHFFCVFLLWKVFWCY